MSEDLSILVKNIIEDGKVNEREVATLRERLYADGKIDREEADAMFEINDRVSGADNHPSWKKLFVGAITRHVLEDETSPGVVDDDEAKYLMEKMSADGKVDDVELETLVSITQKATSCTDEFNQYVLRAAEQAVLEDGIIDDDEVRMIRDIIYGSGGAAGAGVDRTEADFMFRLNDAVSGKENSPQWKALFVEALSKHVLDDPKTPGVVDADEAAYLIEKIEGDNRVDEVELELLVTVTERAQSCDEKLNAFVLKSLHAAIVEDGIIDSDEVAMIKRVIYGSGGGAGEGVDRAEADFLFDLNDACSGKQNAAEWKDLFVEAIGKHVLEDEQSPGAIDADEAAWLISRIEGDGVYDDTEKALLSQIKAKATSIHESLKAKIDEQGI